jgi:hypothetical protein
MRTVSCLVKRAAARDALMCAEAEATCCCGIDTPVSGTRLTRPALVMHGTVGTAASLAMAVDFGGAIGLCDRGAVPMKPLRSQVENGAVNGMIANATSHEARSLEIMWGAEAISGRGNSKS